MSASTSKQAAAVRGTWMGMMMAATGLVLWLTGCSPSGVGGYGTYASPRESGVPAAVSGARKAAADTSRPAEERPGLATKFGRAVRDEWRKESFVRAATKPGGTGMVYYNDKKGVEAMTGYKYRTDASQEVAGGMVEWGIKGGAGFLPTYSSGGSRFVVGRPGGEYAIWVKNRCKSRVEVVLSVDGLDVFDGKPASFAKRGYVIAPGKALEVKGWRTGMDSVARFEFSSVGGSYANLRHGNTRNVGVIGIAVYGEKGVDPWTWMPGEIRDRNTANPFAY